MIAPIDDPAREPDPLHCPGCGAIGVAPCASWCTYAEATAYAYSLDAATDADRDLDEAREDSA